MLTYLPEQTDKGENMDMTGLAGIIFSWEYCQTYLTSVWQKTQMINVYQAEMKSAKLLGVGWNNRFKFYKS